MPSIGQYGPDFEAVCASSGHEAYGQPIYETQPDLFTSSEYMWVASFVRKR